MRAAVSIEQGSLASDAYAAQMFCAAVIRRFRVIAEAISCFRIWTLLTNTESRSRQLDQGNLPRAVYSSAPLACARQLGGQGQDTLGAGASTRGAPFAPLIRTGPYAPLPSTLGVSPVRTCAKPGQRPSTALQNAFLMPSRL